MAENKKSFVLYVDWISTFDQLSDAQAGRLIKHLFRYVNDLNPKSPDKFTAILFEPLKSQLKRDLKKWEELRKKRSNAGLASANKRQHMSTLVESVEQNQQVSTVPVNVNVNVPVTVKEDLNKNTHEENLKLPQNFRMRIGMAIQENTHPFDYIKKNHRAFFESVRIGKKVDDKILEEDFNSTYSYTLFTDENHLMNAFKSTVKKQSILANGTTKTIRNPSERFHVGDAKTGTQLGQK